MQKVLTGIDKIERLNGRLAEVIASHHLLAPGILR